MIYDQDILTDGCLLLNYENYFQSL